MTLYTYKYLAKISCEFWSMKINLMLQMLEKQTTQRMTHSCPMHKKTKGTCQSYLVVLHVPFLTVKVFYSLQGRKAGLLPSIHSSCSQSWLPNVHIYLLCVFAHTYTVCCNHNVHFFHVHLPMQWVKWLLIPLFYFTILKLMNEQIWVYEAILYSF